MKLKTILPIGISIVALTLSGLSFYWSQLRGAVVEMAPGVLIRAGYFDNKALWLTLPLTITNGGAQIITVRKLALVVQSPDSSSLYLLEPLYYQRLAEKGGLIDESIPGPLAIHPGASVSKLVRFGVSETEPEEFKFQQEGLYRVTVLAWTMASENPDIREKGTYDLSARDLKILEEDREGSPGVGYLYQQPMSRWKPGFLDSEETKILVE